MDGVIGGPGAPLPKGERIGLTDPRHPNAAPDTVEGQDERALPPLPTPWDYCYLWNGPYGARKFSAAHHNGRPCDDQVLVFTADQMHAYARAALAESNQVPAQAEAMRYALIEAAEWLHAAYDRPPQTPEAKAMLARINAALSASNQPALTDEQIATLMRRAGFGESDISVKPLRDRIARIAALSANPGSPLFNQERKP